MKMKYLVRKEHHLNYMFKIFELGSNFIFGNIKFINRHVSFFK